MFSALHQLLVDDFASIIFAGMDVDRLLDNSESPTAQRLSRAILEEYLLSKYKETRGEDDLLGMGPRLRCYQILLQGYQHKRTA